MLEILCCFCISFILSPTQGSDCEEIDRIIGFRKLKMLGKPCGAVEFQIFAQKTFISNRKSSNFPPSFLPSAYRPTSLCTTWLSSSKNHFSVTEEKNWQGLLNGHFTWPLVPRSKREKNMMNGKCVAHHQ